MKKSKAAIPTNFDEQANSQLVNDFGEKKVKKSKEELNPTVNIVHGANHDPYKNLRKTKEYPVIQDDRFRVGTGCEVEPGSYDDSPSDVPGKKGKGKK